MSAAPITLLVCALGGEGGGVLAEWTCVSEFQNAGFHLYRRAATIYGGSSEVQKNIIAKGALGL